MAIALLAVLVALAIGTVLALVRAASLQAVAVPSVVTTDRGVDPSADFDAIVASLLGSDPAFAERVARAIDERA